MDKITLNTQIFSGMNATIEFDYSIYNKALIVTDQTMRKIGLYDILATRLMNQKVNFHVFDEVEPNPSYNTIIKGVQEVMEFIPNTIIALGGGSVIDTAKGLIYYSAEVYKELKKDYTAPQLIAIPTTSGAGSEVTSYAVITDTKNRVKIPIVSDSIIPNIAILDPIMTQSCPPKVTAESGFDVLTHVLESYVATNSNMFTEALSEKVSAIVFKNLIKVFQDGNDMQARLAMHEASCLAGIAFTQSGLGLNHAMSHSLGEYFKIPHGRANALLISHVLSFNKKKVADKYAYLALLLGFPASSSEEGCVSLLIAIEYLCNSVQLERSVLEFGISQEEYLQAIPKMAQSAFEDPCISTTPVKPTIQEIETLYKALI